ncbi:MAG: ribonuclease III [Proteobacteria bacterium]|nr:ribonuclease III [Pseudomonadota bacterium]
MNDALAARLGHAFGNATLLAQALTHRSFGSPNNERLEFVGDAVLNCVVGTLLYERYPGLSEGELSRARAALVNGETLARLARDLDVGHALKLGDGERKSGGAARPSMLADALEALFGAVFLDAGYAAAHAAIVRVYGGVLDTATSTVLRKDPKTRLQEWLQARRLAVPEYAVVAIAGEAHAQDFDVECRIPALDLQARGRGTSRRGAEQAAAEAALALLGARGMPVDATR